MILKIRYKPHRKDPEFDCWVYLDGIKKLEIFRTTMQETGTRTFDGYYVNKDDNMGDIVMPAVSLLVNRYGQYEAYLIDEDFYILSDNGKTVERVNI